MTTYPEPDSSQVAVYPNGRPFWLGALGHVTSLVYSSTYPGGDDKMTCVLQVPPSYWSQALQINSPVRVFRGGSQIWSGSLSLPVAGSGGVQITAVGDGNRAQDFRYVYGSPWPTSQPDEGINNAIGRGLPWVNPGVGQPSGIWLGDQPDSGAKNIQEALDTMCSKGGLGWQVNPQPAAAMGTRLSLAPLPTVPTRLLVVPSPVPRTDGGDVRAIFIRYQSAADNTSTGAAATFAMTSVTNTGHGGAEVWMDLSSSGTMTAGAAQSVGQQVLARYQRASFAGPFDVYPGLLLTTGGVPVDPGCERAGFLCKLIVTTFDYGGEVNPMSQPQFIAASYEWDDHARHGTIQPFQNFSTSLSDVMAAAAPPAPVDTTSSS